MQRRTKFLILFAYYFVCVIMGILIALFSTPICLQEQCVQKSSFILSKMDTEVDPCKDFYKFMCGSGREIPPKTESNLTAFATHDPLYEESIYKYMVRKVRNYVGACRTGSFLTSSPLYHEELLSNFFNMCGMVSLSDDMATIEDVQAKLQIVVERTGTKLRDMFNPKKINQSLTPGFLEYRLRSAGFPGRHIFDAEIRRDHKDREKRVLYLGRAEPFYSVALTIDLGQKDKWVGGIKGLINKFIPSAQNKDVSEELLIQVVDFWRELFNIVNKTVEDQKAKDEAVRLSELERRFPSIGFTQLLDKLKASDQNKRYVYIKGNSRTYFAKLSSLLKKYPKHVILAYQITLCLIDVSPFLKFGVDLTMLIGGSLTLPNVVCKSLLGDRFGGLVLSLVIERFDLERNPPDLLNGVFYTYVDAMRAWLEKCSWMDLKTRTSALTKLNAMKTEISMTKHHFDSIKTSGKRMKYYNGLCIQRSILTTLLCMNRFFSRKNFGLFNREITGFDESDIIPMGDITYEQTKNAFQVPIFMLRFPAFDQHWPLHINFGGLGVEISTALIAGFDLSGYDHDKFGINRVWWTDKTMENYKKKERECSSIMQRVEKKAEKNDTSTRSLKEELEQGSLTKYYWKYAMGVKMAMRAYHNFRAKQTFKHQFLPGLEMYPPEQAFFFSHAHMHCLPPNPPEELSKNTKIYFEAISSTKEFKEAFRCSPKRMNPKAAVVNKAARKCMLF